jgi:hypothetical protein
MKLFHFSTILSLQYNSNKKVEEFKFHQHNNKKPSSTDETASSDPTNVGISEAFANFRAETISKKCFFKKQTHNFFFSENVSKPLSPNSAITEDFGPMKSIPASSTALANSADSERNP